MAAFTPATCHRISSSGATSLYIFITADADTDVEGDGYFDQAAGIEIVFRVGDVIIAQLANAELKVYFVSVGYVPATGVHDITVIPHSLAA